MTTPSSSRSGSYKSLWRVLLLVLFLVGWVVSQAGGGTLGCFVSQANLECRPCAPNGDCGPDFICVDKICRPKQVGPDEFSRCEADAGKKPD